LLTRIRANGVRVVIPYVRITDRRRQAARKVGRSSFPEVYPENEGCLH
jgi:hypothetical protein